MLISNVPSRIFYEQPISIRHKARDPLPAQGALQHESDRPQSNDQHRHRLHATCPIVICVRFHLFRLYSMN
ncbi:hypothetical protein SCLCIDRAFT_961877 [Scleroderma citrinum Foug A]|uniref:Uncharacterized protein n=1 Tax=Scleroderma citrinum Foug A TaxID=1036808 RepID=A0A0C3DVV4_9AGAM|nr:hypothetical protein SCLCIDRAFT_961877 [Scleroderma citrinum Foug A]